ncbi:MAG: hypothetical protein ACFE0P_08725 [Oceanicaulis sp.]
MIRLYRPVLVVLGSYLLLIMVTGFLPGAPTPTSWDAAAAGLYFVAAHVLVTLGLEHYATRTEGPAEALREQAVALFSGVAAFILISAAGTILFAAGKMPDAEPALMTFIGAAVLSWSPGASLLADLAAAVTYGAIAFILARISLKAFKRATAQSPKKKDHAGKVAHAERVATDVAALKATQDELRRAQDAALQARKDLIQAEAKRREWAHVLFVVQLFFMFPAAVQIADLAGLLAPLPQGVKALIGVAGTVLALSASVTVSEGLSAVWERVRSRWVPRPPDKETDLGPGRTTNGPPGTGGEEPPENSEGGWLWRWLWIIAALAITAALTIIVVSDLLTRDVVMDGGPAKPPEVASEASQAPLNTDRSDAPDSGSVTSEADTPAAPGAVPGATLLAPDPPQPGLRALLFDRNLPVWAYDSARDVVDEAGRPAALRAWAGVLDPSECERTGGLVAIGLASFEGGRAYNLELSRRRALETRRFALDQWAAACTQPAPPVQLVVARGGHRDPAEPSGVQRPVVLLAIDPALIETAQTPQDLITGSQGAATGPRYLDCEALEGEGETLIVSGQSLCEAIRSAGTGS